MDEHVDVDEQLFSWQHGRTASVDKDFDNHLPSQGPPLSQADTLASTHTTRLSGPFWSLMANFNINLVGFCIAGLFVVVWAAALIYWRVGNVEDKWTPGMAAAPVPAARPTEGAREP